MNSVLFQVQNWHLQRQPMQCNSVQSDSEYIYSLSSWSSSRVGKGYWYQLCSGSGSLWSWVQPLVVSDRSCLRSVDNQI